MKMTHIAGGALLLLAGSVDASAQSPAASPPAQPNGTVACPMGGNGMMGGGMMAGGQGSGAANLQDMHDQMRAMRQQMQAMHKEMMKLRQEMHHKQP